MVDCKKLIFDCLFNHTDLAILWLDSESNILDLNHKVESICQRRHVELVNQPFALIQKQLKFVLPEPPETIHRFVHSRVCQAHYNNLNQENSVDIQWRFYHLADQQGYQGLLIIGVDYSIYTAAIAVAELSKLTLHNIVNNLPHFIFWKDKNSLFQGCNKKFLEATGYPSVHDLVDKTDYDMPWSDGQAEKYIKDDERIMNTELAEIDYEEHQKQKNGDESIMLVSKYPMFNYKKEIFGVLGVYTDITDRRNLEDDLFEAKEEVETANLIRMDFIRNMQHDIRTPFSGIYSVAKLLADEETCPEKKETLNEIVDSAKELLDYCNTILSFSKTEDGNMPVQLKSFDIQALVMGVFKMELIAAKAKGLDLTLQYDDNIPAIIQGDNYRLQRILINLIGNAVKFTQSGSVNINVQLMKMNFESQMVILRFIIEDSGIGIPQEKQQFIFEPFTKATRSNQSFYNGPGLGLKIVRKFVDDLNGDIHLDSELDAGTKFSIDLRFKIPLMDDIVDAC